jgi:hypothetical protein
VNITTQSLPRFPTIEGVWLDDKCIGSIQHRDSIQTAEGPTAEKWVIVQPWNHSNTPFDTKEEAIDFLLKL